MPSLKVPRMSASMVCHEGRLYVLGGVNDSSWVSLVEIFECEEKEWKAVSILLYQLIAVKGVKRSRRL